MSAKIGGLGLATAAVAATLLMTPARSASAAHLQEHITASGEQKCQAFRRVSRDARALQSAQGDGLSAGAQKRLEQQLRRAHAMAPASLTARRCGVAL